MGFDDDEDGPGLLQKIDQRIAAGISPAKSKGKAGASWKHDFALLRQAMLAMPSERTTTWPAGKELLYVIDRTQTLEGSGLVVELMSRERKKSGGWAKPKREPVGSEEIDNLPNLIDRQIVAMIAGARHHDYSYYYASDRASKFKLSHAQYVPVVKQLCESGRCFLRELPHRTT